MMKYKIMTIAVASLLPLGFAATASATGQTADHEVTFTIAEERSISVAVNEGDAVDFGVIGTTDGDGIKKTGAVTVTFSTPSTQSESIQVRLWNSGKSAYVSSPGGVTLTASAQSFAGGPEDGNKQDVELGIANAQNQQVLYGDLEETYLLQSFNVDFELTTNGATAQPDPWVFFVQYSLIDD
jgi:hypothetical protein